MPRTADADRRKGAFEPENPHENGNTSMRGQLPHRTSDSLIKAADSDFPEPGSNPEHSGEKQAPASSDESPTQTQEPGDRQKRNQADQEDDPLAA